MNIEEFREHCLAVPEATESMPFIDPNMLAFKVAGRQFCMASLNPKEGIFWADLKCDPNYTIELREKYRGIGPGHVKTAMMWNRVTLDSDVPDALIVELIRHSVEEVIKAMPKKKREEYRKSSLSE